MKKCFLYLLVLGMSGLLNGQSINGSDLEEILREQDSLLFHISFKTCDRDSLAALVTEDFEFYHDQSGMTEGGERFATQVLGNCKPGPRPAKRILIPGSLNVFPLYNQGELYAALQKGEHRFEFVENGQWKRGSIAKFTHLWILEEGRWKLKRELSYDHRHSGDKEL